MTREVLFLMAVSFFLGMALILGIQGMMDERLPEAFEIVKNGEVVGFADTDPDLTEFVNLSGKDIESPGEYIAFPIYKAKEF